MRKMATIQYIADVQPIEGADKICKYKVNSWWVVDSVGKYAVGDKIIFCEVDSYLPIRPEFEFLRKSSYKKMSDGTEGFRLKTIKLRGQLSQGLILPYGLLLGENSYYPLVEDEDVSGRLGIVNYEPPIPSCLAGQVKGNFPSFLHKTDEPRVQNIKPSEYNSFKGKGDFFYATEKLDGSSCTFYLKDGEFGVCSRNMDLKETEGNTFWKVAREQNVEKIMRDISEEHGEGYTDFAIQGELIGEGVQGNPYKIKGHDFYIFNIYTITYNGYLEIDTLLDFRDKTGLKLVPLVQYYKPLPDTIEECLLMAEGKSELNPNTEREGIVFRYYDRSISFKAISNKFLLKSEN